MKELEHSPNIITSKELAKRWGCTEATLARYADMGILVRLSNLPRVKYSMASVLEAEQDEGRKNPMSYRERRRLEATVKALTAENKKLKEQWGFMFDIISKSKKIAETSNENTDKALRLYEEMKAEEEDEGTRESNLIPFTA